MVYILPLEMTYHDFVIKDNGINVADDTNEGIIKVGFSPEMSIKFQNMTIEGNNIGKGAVFEFVFTDEEFSAESACKEAPNIVISNTSIQNNTSGETTSIFHFEDAPWLWVRFEKQTILNNNFGKVTNEIYSRRFRQIDFLNSTWSQTPMADESRWNSSDTVNKAKFIYMNDTYFHLNITNSTFDCNGVYDNKTIMTMNGYTKKADSSVFKIEKAKDEESIFCHQDA
tara:strand:- start:258 stop:938 length:681 start_codon:yes stop_codon:yes gene_type:complete